MKRRAVDDETPSFDFDAETAPESGPAQSVGLVNGERTRLSPVAVTPASVGVDVKGGASCTLAGESPAASIPSRPDSWREVPQALFLSWSAAMQDSYCAARDDDSAKTAHLRGEDPQFYIGRAKAYRGR